MEHQLYHPHVHRSLRPAGASVFPACASSLAGITMPLAGSVIGAVGAMPLPPPSPISSGARQRARGGAIYSGLLVIIKGLAYDQHR